MELRHLRYFVATVEWKSLREASRRIHVAQPAISQTISNLEAELGIKLLTHRQVSHGNTGSTPAQLRFAHTDSLWKSLRELKVGFCAAAVESCRSKNGTARDRTQQKGSFLTN
jgi:regulatory helix-turn-helix LysR family protein